jgi:hypothetical protein
MKMVATFLLSLLVTVWGKEMQKDEIRAAELYDSGIMMDRIMQKKTVCRSPIAF